MASKVVLSLLFLASVAAAAAAAGGPVNITGSRDITKVLAQFPNFSTLNKLLTQTKVADQINSRQTITLLAVADSAMSSVTSLPADVQEKVLSLHVVLDYYDIDKITNLHNATALLTTLFQASGKALGKAGFLNATYVGDGQIKLGSAADDILTSDVIREIAMQPYNISVIEISQVIVPPGIASSGGNGSSSVGSATPSPAPKADTPEPKEEAPKAAPVSPPKAAPTPKPSSSTSPTPSPKSNSSDDSPAPTTESGPVSSPPTPSSTAPTTNAPASSHVEAPASSHVEAPASSHVDAPAGAPADAPAGAPAGSPADAPAGSADAPAGFSDAPAAGTVDAPAAEASLASRLVVGAGIGAAFLAGCFVNVVV